MNTLTKRETLTGRVSTDDKAAAGVQPDAISTIGREYHPTPIPSSPLSSTIPCMILGLLVGLIPLEVESSLACFIAVGGPAGIAVGVILAVLAVICGYLAFVSYWNFALRKTVCHVLAKQEQAMELWGVAEDRSSAKDVFHQESYSGMVLAVLRDGSTEVK